MVAKRGRRPRADERATARTEIRWTLAELRNLRAMAAANHGGSLSDLFRLSLVAAADDEGRPAPVNLSQETIDRIFERELARRIASGRIAAAAGKSGQE